MLDLHRTGLRCNINCEGHIKANTVNDCDSANADVKCMGYRKRGKEKHFFNG